MILSHGINCINNFSTLNEPAASCVLLANHIGMAKSLHYPAIKDYRYWDSDKRCIDLEGMLEDLRVSTLF